MGILDLSRHLWLPIAAVATLGADCRPVGASGQQERFEFWYVDQSTNTFEIEVPLVPIVSPGVHIALRAVQRLSGGCNREPLAFSQVRSTNPEVAAFVLGDDQVIAMTTGAVGTAELELLDSAGNTVDNIAIEVAPIAAFDGPSGHARLIAGGSYRLELTTIDALGRTVGGGPGRIHHTVSGGVTARQDDSFDGATFSLESPTVGTAALIATAGTATTTLAIQTVAASAVTAIELGTGSFNPRYSPSEQSEFLWTIASTNTGPVYGVQCSWQIDDPSVQLVVNGASYDLGAQAVNSAQFKLTAPGRFDVVCTIGTARLTVTLQR